MNPNQELIQSFYRAFQAKDYKTMQNCYADKAIFNDEAFKNLNAEEVRAMWEMFCIKGKNLHIEFKDVEATIKNGSAEWTATYTFSKTNRNVKNVIKAQFEFENGKIVRHTDSFHFYNWAKQAFGISGMLLGWTGFFQNKVQKQAKINLLNYMKKI